MAKTYDKKAIELCRLFYHQRGGTHHELIEADMRKAGYVNWQKANLPDRGKNGERMGWISKHGFERSLEIYNQGLKANVLSAEQDLYVGIRNCRQTLQKIVEAGKCTKDELYQYRDFCKLEIEARKNLDLSRDNLETFVAGYEKQMEWLAVIDPSGKAVKELVKHGEKLVEMAQAHYGKSEEVSDGAGPGEDESGEQPGSGLRLVK